ncbi:MAG: hypothetical protein QOH60_4754, partial [Mycobacterium sp.]|nr:hypothetical protein [Mycobacterium sp.]
LAPRNIVTRVVSTLLGMVGLGPSMTGSPSAPAGTPLLFTVLAWARREFESLFNPSPAVGGQQLSALTVAPPTAAVTPVMSPNLLSNAGAELGDPSLSGYSSVSMPGWTVTGTPTVIEYGTLRRLPLGLATPGPTLPAFLGFPSVGNKPAGSGAQFFGGGNVATSTISQTVDLSGAASQIDAGAVPYALSADLGGAFIDPSRASVTVTFRNASKMPLGTGQLTGVTALERLFQTGLIARNTTGTIPMGTRSAVVTVTFTDYNPFPGNYNNAYADNISLTVGAPLVAPPPPTPPVSTVGPLDHVFMVYLENHGTSDIIGSPNAPYLNSLINAYGYESNYFALTHPSDPNYYPILGGSDFGLNYNCPTNCFSEPNLADNIEAAGKTWAGYAQSMPFPGDEMASGDYNPDELPFLAFSNIFNDPARAQAHLFPLTQMATDLHSIATTPDFVWFAADENNNGEGPIDFPIGIINFILSQLTTHQYNVAAADQFVQQTIPTIMNSPSWQTQRDVIFITFDEDYNNLSLGIGNQGNKVPMIVIASPNSGMVPGPIVVDDYANHYSLQRTIEDSLGLPPLTNNDAFAEPMNGFWP